MKVSVIVPVYNGEKWLPDCLNSILQQIFSDFEVIAVNDGSQDGSAGVLADYQKKDSRLKVINTENHGVSAARNLGIEHAEGDYIRFVDCDDTLPKDSLLNLVHAIEQGHAQLAIGPFGEVALGKQTRRTLIDCGGTLSRQEYLANLRQYPRSFFYSALWNKLYKRDVIIKHTIRFDELISWSEDFLFNIHYIEHVARVAVLEEVVYDYHHHVSGLTCGFAKAIPRHPFASLRLIVFLFKQYRLLCLEQNSRNIGEYRAFFKGTHGC